MCMCVCAQQFPYAIVLRIVVECRISKASDKLPCNIYSPSFTIYYFKSYMEQFHFSSFWVVGHCYITLTGLPIFITIPEYIKTETDH